LPVLDDAGRASVQELMSDSADLANVFSGILSPFREQRFGLPISFTIDSYERRDRQDVLNNLGEVLLRLYGPSHGNWLEDNALIGITEGRRLCRIGRTDGAPIAVIVETPKGDDDAKLSTAWVAPESRGLGAGSSMFGAFRSWCLRNGFREVHATVSAQDDVAIRALEAAGFRVVGPSTKQYLPDKVELALAWQPGPELSEESFMLLL
jgi:ribosomal protein S18 acetylase RimI-like enzyme